ncbi:hypothetical protein GCM10009718_36160 [Isoptericola halotolerans]|uniref:Lipoprotein n=1 Tax=Isoptericola halotolerans TaxID=300560 RepID=A0ABX2A6N2_9MICO|nr:hypothetical protein [Isoptericola halotolerans]NOV97261.1 hypothetical protein [Isoptericola halotolerans]
MARSARPARPTLAVAGAAAGALLLGACAPLTTQLPYAPSDGSRVDLEGVDARGVNLMVVSAAEGEQGTLLGALANSTPDDVEFVLETPGNDAVSIRVGARETVYLGTEDGEQAMLGTVATIPGGNLEATLSAAGASEDFYLPVLDGTLPEYVDYLP